MQEHRQEYRPSLLKRAAALFYGILYTPFVVARFFLMAAFFIGTQIRKKKNYYSFPFKISDILIVTYPKSGTTLLQMILYQLTTDGDMDIEHISEVSPWFESMLAFPVPNFDKMPEPRLIKSHLAYQKIPKTPCKYIYLTRDGRDTVVSYYHQHRDIFGMKINFSGFFKRFMDGKLQYGPWFKHVYDWRQNTGNLDVLYLAFEDLKRDPEKEIRRIAAFCCIALDDDRLARTLARSSFSFMREHEEKFGPELRSIDGFVRKTTRKKGVFIRKGKTGGWSEYFTDEMREAYLAEHKKWFGSMEPSHQESGPAPPE